MVRLIPNIDLQQIKIDRIEDKDRRLVSGWATIGLRDKQGEIVSVDDLEKLMPIIMERGGVITVDHTDRVVGKIISWERKFNPDFGADGIYITYEIFKHFRSDDKLWEDIKAGKVRGLSIKGGTYTAEAPAVDPMGHYGRLVNLQEGFSITVAERPANVGALNDRVNFVAKSEDVDKKVERRGNKWVVVHCHGPKKGKVIGSHDTKAQAEAQHRAIEANKNKEEIGVLKEVIAKEMHGVEFSELSKEDQEGIFALSEAIKSKQVTFEDKSDRPPKDWWDKTIAALRNVPDVEDPERLAGWIYHHHMKHPPQKAEKSDPGEAINKNSASLTGTQHSSLIKEDGTMEKEKEDVKKDVKKQEEPPEEKKPPEGEKPPEEENKQEPSMADLMQTVNDLSQRVLALEDKLNAAQDVAETDKAESKEKALDTSDKAPVEKLPKDESDKAAEDEGTPETDKVKLAEKGQPADLVKAERQEIVKEVLKEVQKSLGTAETPRPEAGGGMKDVSKSQKDLLNQDFKDWGELNRAVKNQRLAEVKSVLG